METKWATPSRGEFDFNQMCEEIKKFIEFDKNSKYEISVGSDGQRHGNITKFVTAVLVHRINGGAQYYWAYENVPHINSLRQKIMHEAGLTLQYKEILKNALSGTTLKYNIDIVPDVDIGEVGKTKQFIPEIRGMFKGYGSKEEVRIKPYSVSATSIADKHSK